MNGQKHLYGKQTNNEKPNDANIWYPQTGFRHFVDRKVINWSEAFCRKFGS